MCVASNIVEGWDSSKQQPRASAFTNIPWQPLFRRSIYFSLNCWKMKLPSFTGSYTTPSFMNNLWCPTLRLRFEESHLQWWDKKKTTNFFVFYWEAVQCFFSQQHVAAKPILHSVHFYNILFLSFKKPLPFLSSVPFLFFFCKFLQGIHVCIHLHASSQNLEHLCAVFFFFFFFCVSLLERCWQFERSVPCFPFGSFGFAGLLSSLFFLVCSFLWPYI